MEFNLKLQKIELLNLLWRKTRCKELSKLFTGPTAVALLHQITSAKILTSFSKENTNLKILVESWVKIF